MPTQLTCYLFPRYMVWKTKVHMVKNIDAATFAMRQNVIELKLHDHALYHLIQMLYWHRCTECNLQECFGKSEI